MFSTMMGESFAWALFAFGMYLFAGYYSFEQMALTATEEEKYFLADLRNGVFAARVVWVVYVLGWLPLRALQWLRVPQLVDTGNQEVPADEK